MNPPGTKYSVAKSVTSLRDKATTVRDKVLPSGSDGSADAQNAKACEPSRTPSSNESKQENTKENLQQDLATPSGLHQKKSAPGQVSSPNKHVESYSDEDNDLSTAFFSESDLESADEFGNDELENLDVKSTVSHGELAERYSEGLPHSDVKGNHELAIEHEPSDTPPAPASTTSDVVAPSDVKGSHEFPTDHNSNDAPPASPYPIEDAVGPSDAKSDKHDDISQAATETYVLQNVNEQSGQIPVESPESLESTSWPEESINVEARHEADTSTESKDESFTVSASPVVPKEAAEEVLESLGLETKTRVGELSFGAPQPSASVPNTLSSSLGSESWQSDYVGYFGIPAPSAPSAAAQARPGSVLVPATIDHEQEQAFAALQALKVC
jgi:hypothetical protein